jgi:predicted HAD superfamily Cof-like phosphohydrolase
VSRVREFHQAFDQPAPSHPSVPDLELAQFRKRLITEEIKEVEADFAQLMATLRQGRPYAETTPIMQNLVKELCDLRYVVEGALVAFGVDPDAAYDEVHRSNMSKLGADGKPIRREDGKALKGPNYTPADPDKMFPSVIDGTVHEED